jgi:hypothetical protein
VGESSKPLALRSSAAPVNLTKTWRISPAGALCGIAGSTSAASVGSSFDRLPIGLSPIRRSGWFAATVLRKIAVLIFAVTGTMARASEAPASYS